MNLIILIGHIGKDPEQVQNSEHQITKFSLATTEKYKDKTETIWHNLIVYNKLAEVALKYLKKGDKISVTGKQINRSYDKQDGTKAYVSEVRVDKIEFHSNKQHSDSAQPQASQTEPIEDTGDLPF